MTSVKRVSAQKVMAILRKLHPYGSGYRVSETTQRYPSAIRVHIWVPGLRDRFVDALANAGIEGDYPANDVSPGSDLTLLCTGYKAKGDWNDSIRRLCDEEEAAPLPSKEGCPVEQRILSDQASQAWAGFVGSQAPAEFMTHLWAMGYLTVEAATDAYEANIPFMFDGEAEPAGAGKLLAEYILWALPDIEPAGRTNPAAVDALKQEIAKMVNRRQHAQADHLAARGAEHMDCETLRAFVTWANALGIRDVSEWSAGDTLG